MVDFSIRVSECRVADGYFPGTDSKRSNETEEARAQNRRVDILIMNEHGMMGEPAAAVRK
jgi:hypothetical protein